MRSWAAPLYYDLGANHGAQPEKVGVKSATTTVSAISAAPMVFVAIAPCRIMDTRDGSGYSGQYGWPAIPGGTSRTVTIAGQCGIPAGAKAFSLNVVAWPNGGGPWTQVRWLSMWPTGDPAVVSTLNDFGATAVANAAVVPAGSGGAIDIYVSDWSHVFLDTNGYYIPPSALALSAGTAGAPALTFSNDANSGIYSSAAGTLKVTSAGTDRLTVDASGISVAGDVNMTGELKKSGTSVLGTHSASTHVGLSALSSLTTGPDNTAVGYQSMYSLTTGGNNTAVGKSTMYNNASGSQNVAVGDEAFSANLSGSYNTALGYYTGRNNTGAHNVLVGNYAGYNTGAANYNTLVGSNAGNRASGGSNSMLGYRAGYNTTTGANNSIVGYQAGQGNTTGSYNSFFGNQAGYSSAGGENNTAIGSGAGYQTTGIYNTLIGAGAGLYDTTGSYNLRINHLGTAGETKTARIGMSGMIDRVFISGIRGVTTGKADVVHVLIDSDGQLGTVNSSRTVKRDIRDMGDTTATIMGLRPVRFRYTAHGADSPEQYGLIAEEVAEVAPDLVARKGNGDPETVYYHKVDAMLLNEVQKQFRLLESQAELIRGLQQQNELIRTRLAEFENRLK